MDLKSQICKFQSYTWHPPLSPTLREFPSPLCPSAHPPPLPSVRDGWEGNLGNSLFRNMGVTQRAGGGGNKGNTENWEGPFGFLPPLSSSASASSERRKDSPDPLAGAEFSQGLMPTLLQSPIQPIPLGSQKAQPTAGLCNQQPRCGWDSGLRQLPLSSPRPYGLYFTLELYSSNIPVPIPDRPHPGHHPPPATPENT